MKKTFGEHTILVIEDERPLSDAIMLKLKSRGYGVTTARTIEQALQYCLGGLKVDAIWLDHYLLGKETGLDFLVHLKEHLELKKVPIFVVSNTGSPDKRMSYMRLGVIKYFVKSDNRLETIIGEIDEFLKNKVG